MVVRHYRSYNYPYECCYIVGFRIPKIVWQLRHVGRKDLKDREADNNEARVEKDISKHVPSISARVSTKITSPKSREMVPLLETNSLQIYMV